MPNTKSGPTELPAPDADGLLPKGTRHEELGPGILDVYAAASDLVSQHQHLAQRVAEAENPQNDPHVVGAVLRQENEDLGVAMRARKEDASRLEQESQRINEQLLIDDLTQLPNGRALREKLHKLFESGAAPSSTIFLIDLDGFKTINDQLGHAVGDEVLKAVGDQLRAVKRHDDFAARDEEDQVLGEGDFAARENAGGDEYYIVAEGFVSTDEKLKQRRDAIEKRLQGTIAGVVRKHLHETPQGSDELPFYVGATVVFGSPKGGQSIDEFLKELDAQKVPRKEEKAGDATILNYNRRRGDLFTSA